MNMRRSVVLVTFAAAFVLAMVSALVYAAGAQQGHTVAPASEMAAPGAPASLPPNISSPQSTAGPAALASTLSYYFISGNTFTPGGSVAYARQVIGCVNQMPQGVPFSAPVHLPQGSRVVSITLYTYDSAITTTVSTAYFILDDG